MLIWLWKRLSNGGAEASVSGRALRRFPAREIEGLLRARVLIEQRKADSWSVCTRCDCGLDARPIREVGGQIRACCPHDAAEDLVLDDDDIKRFSISADRLAGAIAASGGLSGDVVRIGDGIWFIGNTPTGRAVVLCSDTDLLDPSTILAIKTAAAAENVSVLTAMIAPPDILRLRAAGLDLMPLGETMTPHDDGHDQLVPDRLAPSKGAPRLVIDRVAREVELDGQKKALSAQSFDLLVILAAAAVESPAIVENRKIEEQLWGSGLHRISSEVREPIRTLRNTLAKDSREPERIRELIENRRNPNGYRLAISPADIKLIP